VVDSHSKINAKIIAIKRFLIRSKKSCPIRPDFDFIPDRWINGILGIKY
jgi:hypothetical protein